MPSAHSRGTQKPPVGRRWGFFSFPVRHPPTDSSRVSCFIDRLVQESWNNGSADDGKDLRYSLSRGALLMRSGAGFYLLCVRHLGRALVAAYAFRLDPAPSFPHEGYSPLFRLRAGHYPLVELPAAGRSSRRHAEERHRRKQPTYEEIRRLARDTRQKPRRALPGADVKRVGGPAGACFLGPSGRRAGRWLGRVGVPQARGTMALTAIVCRHACTLRL